jgi:hypothetical protein
MAILACVVGIPAAALSGTSWEEIVKKFQNFRLPDILPAASASTSPPTEAGQLMPEEPRSRLTPMAEVLRRRAEQPPAAEGDAPVTGDPECRDIQGRLRQLGATHYVLELLEAWKEQPQAYRFYCTVAVNRGSDQTQAFEATAGEPRQAMAEVLRQVERWRGGR